MLKIRAVMFVFVIVLMFSYLNWNHMFDDSRSENAYATVIRDEVIASTSIPKIVETTTTSVPATTLPPTTTTVVTTTVPPVPSTTVPPPVTTTVVQVQAAQSNINSFLACVRQRESRGDYTAVNSSSGAGGAYQFLQSTWNTTANHIGRGDLVGIHPSNVDPATQDMMAVALYNWQGESPWAYPASPC